jgi:hypothetical protein
MGPFRARRLLIDEYGHFCFSCGYVPQFGDSMLDVDHIVPVRLGGHDVYENYQLLCRPCNQRKWISVIDYRPDTRSLNIVGVRPVSFDWERNRPVRRLPNPPRPAGPYEWVNVSEASKRLGVSVSTVRRMIEAGDLVAEREPLAQGSSKDRFLVRFEAPLDSDDASPSEPPDAPQAPTEPPAAITALVDALAAERAERQRLSAENGELRERAGRLEGQVIAVNAERDALRAEVERLQRRGWWARLWGR